MTFCSACGQPMHETATQCPHCGAPNKDASAIAAPPGVKGWSWGAFLLNGFWAVGNRVWIGLLSFVPYVGFIMAIVLGIKGREWAWKTGRWETVEAFNASQRSWSKWGAIISIGAMLLGVASAILIGHSA
jgi:hypothetical protein